jgi:hypothetical protein
VVNPAVSDCRVGAICPAHIALGATWEAATGLGALVGALKRAGRETIATDIEPQRRNIARLDYLKDPPPPTRGAIVVTNPPFSQRFWPAPWPSSTRVGSLLRRSWFATISPGLMAAPLCSIARPPSGNVFGERVGFRGPLETRGGGANG